MEKELLPQNSTNKVYLNSLTVMLLSSFICGLITMLPFFYSAITNQVVGLEVIGWIFIVGTFSFFIPFSLLSRIKVKPIISHIIFSITMIPIIALIILFLIFQIK